MRSGKIPENKRGYLHIGSRLPVADLKKARIKRHSLVDPYFSSLGRIKLFILRKRFSAFEFSSQFAHDFLDFAILSGLTYHTVRIDMPYEGIIDMPSDFESLCKKIHKVLVPNGKLILLTDYVPNKAGVVHVFSGGRGADFVYRFLNGRDLDDLGAEEKEYINNNICEEKTANISQCLKKAGFGISFFKTENPTLIGRSQTAISRSKAGKPIYLVIATKN